MTGEIQKNKEDVELLSPREDSVSRRQEWLAESKLLRWMMGTERWPSNFTIERSLRTLTRGENSNCCDQRERGEELKSIYVNTFQKLG